MQGVPQLLADDIAALDDHQRSALMGPGNVVIVAGPGSGKTRTLAARAAYLLYTRVSPLRGLAAITYTNQAALELRESLARLGVRGTHRLFAGTVHAFCLGEILPYAALVGVDLPSMDTVMTGKESDGLRDECADIAGANLWGLREAFAALRRRMAAGEDVSDRPADYVNAVRRYETECDRQGIWDFDGVIFKSVALLRDFPKIAEVVQAKYPVVMVDEYQDLGAGLHRLVEVLAAAGVEITAVGDADQSIFGFAGGDPRYLDALCQRGDFSVHRLETNYRCGSAVIAAAELALAASRGWQADPRRTDVGVIEIRVSDGDSRSHAAQTAEVVDEFLAAGVPPHEVAVLLRFRSPLAPLIHDELTSRGVAVRLEGTSSSPQSAVGKWLASAALYAIFIRDALAGREYSGPAPDGADVLLDLLDGMRSRAGQALDLRPAAARLGELHASLCGTHPDDARFTRRWAERVERDLGLAEVANHLGDRRNGDELNALLGIEEDQHLDAVASDLESTGRVSVGTYHGAKGRTFTAVVLPSLTEGVVPPWGLHYGQPVPLQGAKLREERRGFYVALTRSRGTVLIQAARSGVDNRGRTIERGFSSFAQEIATHLGESMA